MDEDPGLSDQYRLSSPWPVFVAIGLTISEIGILFNVFPLAVGGLMLLGGSVAGIAAESGYAKTPWRALGVCAVLLFGLGGALLYAEAQTGASPVQWGERGQAVLVAATILLLGAGGGELLGRVEEASI